MGLTFKNVSKQFGAFEAVRDLSLDIAPGAFAVFLGPSGCGKSTLLRMIAGIEPVSSGEIHMGSRRIDQLAPGARGVAMVFQHYALYPHMTVRQNMAFGLRNVGLPQAEIETKISTASQLLEIESLLDRKPAQLSGGQRQRVAIGRAIVKQPQLFLFDEPLSNLDAALRSRTRIELVRLHNRVKATMVFVTHDQVEAMTMGTQIVVMNKGRIEQVGAPMDIYRTPATQFVASFIGTPAMNMMAATPVGEKAGGVVVRLADGTMVETQVSAAAFPSTGAVTLGVRAEHVQPGQGRPARVDVVERLGERTLVYAVAGDRSTIVYDEPGDTAPGVGDQVALSLDPAHVHLFDATGRAFHALGAS